MTMRIEKPEATTVPTSAPTASPAAARNVAAALVDAFTAHGTRRLFGLPGGGSSLDIIEAARRAGLPFVLARHECAAVFMAAATAELDGSLGVALTTKGPGTANAVNGAAHAALDRCAVAVLTDGFSPALRAYVTHQWFDQRALLAPLVHAHATLDGPDAADEIARVTAAAFLPVPGPVHLELTGTAARGAAAPRPYARAAAPAGADAAGIERARAMLAGARRPVVVAGLEACDPASSAALRRLLSALGCPALVTYKAKGTIDDDDPQCVGIFTGGAAEQPTVGGADLIVLVGVDPVELILQPWAYSVPVLDLCTTPRAVHYLTPELVLAGRIDASVAALAEGARRCTGWAAEEIGGLRAAMRASLAYRGDGSAVTPQQAVELAARAASGLPVWPRVTVDAGAHMFSATAFWPCHAPRDLLISNGLATMGFALPAAIASVLHEPQRTAIAFTGDGGLLMCLGELATAVETGAPLVVVVFNDGALSLIDIKQRSRSLPAAGVHWGRVDFAQVMRGFGGAAWCADTPEAYERALAAALDCGGPALIDVTIDPSGYPAQLAAMRG
jgi:acetolactate synthase-1/2/3 large subunit